MFARPLYFSDEPMYYSEVMKSRTRPETEAPMKTPTAAEPMALRKVNPGFYRVAPDPSDHYRIEVEERRNPKAGARRPYVWVVRLWTRGVGASEHETRPIDTGHESSFREARSFALTYARFLQKEAAR